MFSLILTMIIIITSLLLCRTTPRITIVPSTLKVNVLSDIKENINNLISCARLIPSSKTISYEEIRNIKQTLINFWFLTILLMNKLNI